MLRRNPVKLLDLIALFGKNRKTRGEPWAWFSEGFPLARKVPLAFTCILGRLLRFGSLLFLE
jgi:hypothetical protein